MPFPEKISRHYASKFIAGTRCPLKMQVKFNAKEKAKAKGFTQDAVGDAKAQIKSGILQKYKGRLLIMASGCCAVHCRFCFRRNLQQKKNSNLLAQLAKILKKDKNIKEIILSGGDPLMLKNDELRAIFNIIPQHLKIRIHSRIPVALPSRFTKPLQRLLKQLGSRLVFVSHINHPNELDLESKKIFSKMRKHGITLLNQSVLLKGVNNDAKILAALSEKLFSQHILPYYLHQLDRVQGAAHFEVPIKEAKKIFKELKENLPGYLVPKLVKEAKGAKAKVWL
jgi:EF-P beta-lysylation protein EpmB